MLAARVGPGCISLVIIRKRQQAQGGIGLFASNNKKEFRNLKM